MPRSENKRTVTDHHIPRRADHCTEPSQVVSCSSCNGKTCARAIAGASNCMEQCSRARGKQKTVCFSAPKTSFPRSFPCGEEESEILPSISTVTDEFGSAEIVPEKSVKSGKCDATLLHPAEHTSSSPIDEDGLLVHRHGLHASDGLSCNDITPTSIMTVDVHRHMFPTIDDEKFEANYSNRNAVCEEIGDTQTLHRRTQSTPICAIDSKTAPDDCDDVLSGLQEGMDSEANITADSKQREIVESVRMETHYHLHSKMKDVASFSMHTSVSDPPKLVTGDMNEESPVSSSTSSESNVSETHQAPKTLFDYTRYLMGMDFSAEMHADSDPLEDAWSVATKRRGVYNLIQVPVRLERLLSFVMFICADEFLSMFTFLPLRALYAMLKLLWYMLCLPLRVLLRGIRGRHGKRNRIPGSVRKMRTKARIGNVVDILHFSVLVITSVFLALLDISWVYHNIRGQSVIKLYVVFNVMEIFDRLCSSFGVDILDSLGWTTASAVSFLSRENGAAVGSDAQSGSATRARAVQSVWLLSRVAFDYIFTLVYTGVHATLLLTWVVTLNVAINTKNNALITLLIANNFVELKGSVFKSYKVQNVFQIACSDGVERFQLTIFLLIMVVYTAGNNGLVTTWVIVYACEIMVDWIKHAFVTKFNRIPHRVYPQFSIVIAEDIAHARSHSVVRSVGGSAVSKRIGFVSLPLGALSARMAASTIGRMPIGAGVLLFATMIVTKIALSIGLLGHAQRRLSRAAQQHNEWPKEEEELESKWYHSLVNVGRYDMIAKT